MPTLGSPRKGSTIRNTSVLLIAALGLLSIGSMTTASAGIPGPTDCGAGALQPQTGTGRIVAKGEAYCEPTMPPLPYVQIRVKLLRKKIGSPEWVMIARGSGSSRMTADRPYFLVKVSRACKVGRYKTATKVLYRWDVTEPWTVYQDWFRSPSKVVERPCPQD